MQIHHVGYLVKKMDRAIAAFSGLGYEMETPVVYDDYREIDICFLTLGGYRIELISPKNTKSVVAGLLKKLGNCPYHICYCCKDINKEVLRLREKGYVMNDEPHEAIALSNRKVCFMIHPYLGMIELLEGEI